MPGDLQSKVDPYLRPLYDALYEILGADAFMKNMEKGLIEVAPLAYMRGRTLDNAYIILDEAQNTTPAQMKMFLTRIGFGSKAIITGDLTQKDLPFDSISGLEESLRVLRKVKEIGVCELTNKDVVRHPLVQKIVAAYDQYEAARSAKKNKNNNTKRTEDRNVMSIIIENEYEGEINIPYEKIAHEVIEAAIDYVDCPYECEVNLMLTNNETIHAINKEQREIDRPTDVLSFPMAEYEEPADFSKIEEDPMAFDPESSEFLLGDIVISMDKVWEQAENYGHSREREYAFLIAHSMLHLFGYDHMEEEERKDMEKRQEEILTKTKYTRDERGLV